MNNKPAVLVVEDDPAMRATCGRMLTRAGYEVTVVGDGESALEKLRSDSTFRVALLDLKLPKMNGTTVLEKIKESDYDVKVIIMTGFATVKGAVQTMKLGAVDYLVKPFEKDELLAVVAQQFHVGELEARVERLQSELRGKYRFDNIIGQSKSMEPVFEHIVTARENRANVLIVGESGTGKELIAKAIHYNGPRADKPFVAINCTALPESLIESELFGHIKGAFTGATRESIGLFRSANGGTLFLDEVAEMPMEAQSKLLRTIQERTVRPVGGLTEIPIDVRIVAATNQDLVDALESGRLRKDLFYRLSVITIRVPPLRERREDIRRLVDHFTVRFSAQYSCKCGIRMGALDILERYSWPGNVRELENLVECWFATGIGEAVAVADLPAELVDEVRSAERTVAETPPGEVIPLRDAEKELVLRALEVAGQNKSKAAHLLGISRKKLYKLLSEGV